MENKTKYIILNKPDQIDDLIECCKKTGYCSHDFETNAERIYRDNFYPTILGVCFEPGKSAIIPLAHFDSPFKKDWESKLIKFGRGVIENPKIIKVGWNIKFESQIWMRYGVFMQGRIFDAMLAKYLLDEERPNDLKSMVSRFMPQYGSYEEDYEGCKLPWDQRPLKGLSQYCAMDSDLTLRLMLFFERRLIKGNFYNLYRNLYMPASKTITSMERNGMRLNIPFNDELHIKYKKLITETENELRSIKRVMKFEKSFINDRKDQYIYSIQHEINKLEEEIENEKDIRKVNSKRRSIVSREQKIARITAGEFTTKKELELTEPINFASPKQLIELFFKHRKGFKFPILAYTKKDKKDTDTPSTAEDILIKLKEYDKSGFMDKLLKLRGYQTIYGTFVSGIREALCDDGRIHPRFLLHGTVTSRLSSQNPNFQNLPRPATNPDIKRMMIPGEGKLFLQMDYSQAELRILAHLAKEKSMLEWFRTGRDIHLSVACKKYKENYDDIFKIYSDETHPEYKKWKVRRKQAKTIIFGIVYEQTAMKLSESLSTPENPVSIQEAQEFLDEIFEMFPRLKKYIKKQHDLAEKLGYVINLFGFKRRLPNVWSDNYAKYLEALRFATNSPVQGAASCMALFSSVLIREAVLKGKLPWMDECTTVHDSLVFELFPKGVNAKTIYNMWDICRNPETQKYFGFKIEDVEMMMDFGVGRTYDEELPFIPGYDYNKLLSSSFSTKEYYEEHENYKGIHYREYKKKFSSSFIK